MALEFLTNLDVEDNLAYHIAKGECPRCSKPNSIIILKKTPLSVKGNVTKTKLTFVCMCCKTGFKYVAEVNTNE